MPMRTHAMPFIGASRIIHRDPAVIQRPTHDTAYKEAPRGEFDQTEAGEWAVASRRPRLQGSRVLYCAHSRPARRAAERQRHHHGNKGVFRVRTGMATFAGFAISPHAPSGRR